MCYFIFTSIFIFFTYILTLKRRISLTISRKQVFRSQVTYTYISGFTESLTVICERCRSVATSCSQNGLFDSDCFAIFKETLNIRSKCV